MPTRMLRDWTASKKVNGVSEHAEIFFTRLIMKVDDYGRYYADEQLLLAYLFPLRMEQWQQRIAGCMAELASAGLIELYTAEDGRHFLQIKDFGQRLRQKKKRFPQPINQNNVVDSNAPPIDSNMRANDSNRPQVVMLKEKRREEEYEEENEYEGEEKGTHSPFFNSKKQNENPSSFYDIENLLTQALHDVLWMKRVNANEYELRTFNEILEKRYKTRTTPEDYRAHFASMKAKYPERFVKKKSIEELYEDARREDAEHQKSQKKN